MRFYVILGLFTLCVILATTVLRKDTLLEKAIDTGILQHAGKNYHVIPWEGATP